MGRPMSEVGKFVRQTLMDTDDLKNSEIAERVMQHFPEQQFDEGKLRQFVANCRYRTVQASRTEDVR